MVGGREPGHPGAGACWGWGHLYGGRGLPAGQDLGQRMTMQSPPPSSSLSSPTFIAQCMRMCWLLLHDAHDSHASPQRVSVLCDPQVIISFNPKNWRPQGHESEHCPHTWGQLSASVQVANSSPLFCLSDNHRKQQGILKEECILHKGPSVFSQMAGCTFSL